MKHSNFVFELKIAASETEEDDEEEEDNSATTVTVGFLTVMFGFI